MFANQNGIMRNVYSSKSFASPPRKIISRTNSYDDPYLATTKSTHNLPEGRNVYARNSAEVCSKLTQSNSLNNTYNYPKNGFPSKFSSSSEKQSYQEPILNNVNLSPTKKTSNGKFIKIKENKEFFDNQIGKPPKRPLSLNTSSKSSLRRASRTTLSTVPLLKDTLPRCIQNEKAIKARPNKAAKTTKTSSIPVLMPRHLNPHIDQSQQSWKFTNMSSSEVTSDKLSPKKKKSQPSKSNSVEFVSKWASEEDFLTTNRYLDPANKHAYVSSITDENQVPFALVLSSLLVQTRTYAALVIIIGDDFTSKAKSCLKNVYDKVIPVKKEKHFPHGCVTEFCWEAFVKIHCWALVDFKKCIYLDVDCLLLKNVDELFQCEEISAVPSSRWSDFFSTGVFVLKPSDNTFQFLSKYTKNFAHQEETEETIINSFFYNWSQFDSKRLSQLYNVDANCNPKIIKRYKNNIRIFRCSEAWTYWMQEEDKPIVENSGTIIVSLPAYSYQSYLLKWFVALFENEHVYNWISNAGDGENDDLFVE